MATLMSSCVPAPPHLLPTATPASYLRYAFDLPEQRFVGLLACQRDPLSTTLDTKVTRCDKVKVPLDRVATAGAKGKKVTGAALEVSEWEVELLDTGSPNLLRRICDQS